MEEEHHDDFPLSKPSRSQILGREKTIRDFAMEFQSSEDDAWYDVELLRDGDTLTIKYVNFPEEFNETVDVGKFKTIEELGDFKRRFRQSSVQLQDHDCHKVVQGKTVCASYNFKNGEVKFFDAMVVEVLNEQHKFSEEEEECFCNFVLKWHDGPMEGVRTFAKIGDICLTPHSKQVDSSLASFLKIARERIENGSLGVNESEDQEEPNSSTIGNNSYVDPETFFMKLRRQRRNRCAFRTMEARLHGHCKRIQQVMDEDVSSAS